MPLARIALAAAALALLSTGSARAGVVIEGTDDGETQRFVMDGQKLRLESGKQGEAMIFDGAKKTSVQLDPANKTYTEFTNEDLAAIQAMAKTSGVGKKVRSTRYEKTGKTDKALGKSCDVYRVVESGGEPGEEQDEQTVCLAPFGTFGISRADFAPFTAFGDYASQLAGGEIDRGWADIPGVPLIAWEKEDGETKETFRATKVEKKSVPASEFAVPAGWKKGPGFAEQMRQMKQQYEQHQQQQPPAGK
jgi:hypothetical protein